ncbi:MAG: YbbC/YhhH family protein, partial [Burkholderiaceae bacterium]|nr:YbbC/YhhH family protein [Burkholderiaceae bacterium]
PKEGLVPTAEVAIRIAVAIWEPIYGKENIERQKPYTAKLVNGVWHVEGFLPPDRMGGTALAEISQTNGTVLRVSHGQ